MITNIVFSYRKLTCFSLMEMELQRKRSLITHYIFTTINVSIDLEDKFTIYTSIYLN